jgi:ABC-2 type transport system ATP-binding protein
MLEVSHLTKRFGALTAVDDLSFSVQPGRVTGFLGPNGAGKTTTLRVGLGLVGATQGRVTFDGRRYRDIRHPMREIGAALEASSFHPGRTALDHLLMLAPLVEVPDHRCRQVLDLVGLADVADKRVGQFSLGMRGRLALAATLLGDPTVLLLDEPTNGLDPEGIAWMRGLLRHLALEGRTILISSHLLSEVEQGVDDVVIIAHGRLVHASALADLEGFNQPRTLIAAADPATLATLAAQRGWPVESPGGSPDLGGALMVVGPSAAEIGHACFAARLEIHQLTSQSVGLEAAFLALTEGQEGLR